MSIDSAEADFGVALKLKSHRLPTAAKRHQLLCAQLTLISEKSALQDKGRFEGHLATQAAYFL